MIENHICSLSLAKQLKEARWKKKTIFSWGTEGLFQPMDSNNQYFICYAPTATEILEELPDRLTEGEIDYFLTIWKEHKSYFVQYEINRSTLNCASKEFHEESLSHALAKVWLYLKQNNLLEKE